jgi:hypothetical protein
VVAAAAAAATSAAAVAMAKVMSCIGRVSCCIHFVYTMSCCKHVFHLPPTPMCCTCEDVLDLHIQTPYVLYTYKYIVTYM